MKFGSYVRAAALAAAVVTFTAPAMGQVTHVNQMTEAQRSEMYCVSDELEMDDDVLYAVAEAVIYDDPTEEVEAALLKVIGTCETRYKWDEARGGLGVEIGVANVMIEYFVEELYADGIKDEHIPAIDRVLAKLSKDELSRFIDDEDVFEDDAFIERINTLLAAEKFPSDDDYVLETALLIMQTFVAQSSAISEWVEAYINKKN